MVTLDEAGREAPPVRRPAPGSPLAPWVELVSIQPGRPDASSAARRRVVPDPNPHLVVAALEGGRVRASIVGARTRFCDVDVRRRFTIAVRLRPGVLSRLSRLPASDFVDLGVRLGDVLPDGGAVEDAAAAGDAEACLERMLALLGRRLGGAPPVDWRVAALEDAWRRPGSAPEVAALARGLGVGARTLRATAAAEVGLSPVLWRRIRRLLVALERALGNGAGEAGWSRVAAASGYHDQPHMVRDFRALLGETPGAFLGRRRRADPYKTPGGPDARLGAHAND